MSPVPVRQVLCLSGSLRRVSANTALLEAACRLAPPGLALSMYGGLGRLPLFNPDDEVDPLPAAVCELREAVGRSDALLIACPEYAHGVPGAFKNLLDWLVGSLEFPGKPVVLVNTSGRGSHHAQDALAEILRTMSARLLPALCCTMPLSGAGMDVASILADDDRARAIGRLLSSLAQELATP